MSPCKTFQGRKLRSLDVPGTSDPASDPDMPGVVGVRCEGSQAASAKLQATSLGRRVEGLPLRRCSGQALSVVEGSSQSGGRTCEPSGRRGACLHGEEKRGEEGEGSSRGMGTSRLQEGGFAAIRVLGGRGRSVFGVRIPRKGSRLQVPGVGGKEASSCKEGSTGGKGSSGEGRVRTDEEAASYERRAASGAKLQAPSCKLSGWERWTHRRGRGGENRTGVRKGMVLFAG